MTRRPVTFIALAALTMPLLAGCLADDAVVPGAVDEPLDVEALLTQPIFEDLVFEEHTVTMSDGVKLYLNLFRPETEDNVPTIVVMTPYMTTQDLTDAPYSGALRDYFGPRGYAVAFVNVRGTHNSGGCLDQTSHRQALDGYEVVEWLGTQEWSSGKVGMFGASYDGETQQSTAVLAPPHLTTIVPVASITSQYLWFYKGGIPYDLSWIGMTSYMLTGGLVPGHTEDALASYPERVPCHVENHEAAMDPEGAWSEYWEDRHYKDEAANVTASVLYVHGLQDWNVKPDAIPGWFNDIQAPKKAVLGQWGHAYPTRADWPLTLHRWFDHWLMGIDTGIMVEPAVQIEDNLGRWRNESAFPPLDAEPLTLYARRDALSSVNRLDPTPPRETEPSQAYRDTPAGPANLLRTAPRVTYVSHPFLEDVHVSGVPEVVVYGSSSATSTHWIAHLIDLAPDGSQRTFVRAYLNSRYHGGDLRQGEDLTPGEVYRFALDSFPVDHVLREGHRLAVAVMSADDWTMQDDSFATNLVHHTPDAATHVTLPVIHRSGDAHSRGPHAAP